MLSNWDICGLILANAISMMFRINNNLYIIFCGKKEKIKMHNDDDDDNKKYNTNLFLDIKNFQKLCFLSNSSLISTGCCIIFGCLINFWVFRIIIRAHMLVVLFRLDIERLKKLWKENY